jgi:hypothetical protein
MIFLILSGFIVLGSCFANQSEIVLADYSFEEGDWDMPTGWRKFGDVTLATWSELFSISGNRCIGLVDNNDMEYCQWQSESIHLPDGLENLHLEWQECHDISTGQMRLTILIMDSDNNIIDQQHIVVSGRNCESDDIEFTTRSENIHLPNNSDRIIIAMVSGGQVSAKGTFYIDNLKLTSSYETNIINHTTPRMDTTIVPVVYYDMEQKHDLYDDRPKEWEYSGNTPYQATWACDISNSGVRSLKIKDNDIGSHGMWFTSRTALPENTTEIELSSALKLKNIQGSWKIVLCYYDVGAEHNYSPVNVRMDGCIHENTDHLTIQWATIDPNGITPLFTSTMPQTEKNSKGFWQVKVKLPVNENAKCFRIGIMSGWNPINTGCIWLDDVGIAAIQKQ